MKLLFLRLVAAIACLAPSLAADGEKVRPADVFILSGQSNMQGIGAIADISEDDRAPQGNAFFWTGKMFVPLVPGTTQTSTRPGEFGPEITFAKTVCSTSPTSDVYIVKFSLSGQPLHHGWDGEKWASGEPAPGRATFYPGESRNDPNTGKHYLRLRATMDAALADLRARNVAFTVRGFAWMQGEADAKNETSALEYAASLKRLKRRLEEDLGVKSLPFVFGQALPHEPAMARFTHRVELRESMRRADESSGHADAIPGMKMVSTDGFTLKPDTVHYDAAGQSALGRKMAEAMLALLKNAQP